jgi:ABC-type lipopolysaccharide export system ATPase subunit
MIEARGLSKRYGDKLAVDDLSFSVKPGQVTGFLGPNGAGKPNPGQRHFCLCRWWRRVAGQRRILASRLTWT